MISPTLSLQISTIYVSALTSSLNLPTARFFFSSHDGYRLPDRRVSVTVNCEYADVHFRRGPAILAEREKIKAKTIQNRRLINQRHAA